jgi:hypothetical protein
VSRVGRIARLGISWRRPWLEPGSEVKLVLFVRGLVRLVVIPGHLAFERADMRRPTAFAMLPRKGR